MRIDQGVAEISIAEQLSAGQPEDGVRRLNEAFWAASDSDAVKCIVLYSGQGVGPGVASLRASAERSEQGALFGAQVEDYLGATGLYQSVAYCKKVVVWEASGESDGPETLLALYSDFVVAATDTSFRLGMRWLPETNLALCTLTLRLQAAKAWVLGGRPLSTHDAQRLGLVSAVAAPERLHEEALRLARRVARMPLDAIVASKLAFQIFLDTQGVDTEFDAAPFYALAQLNGSR